VTMVAWHLVELPATIRGRDGSTYRLAHIDRRALPLVVHALDESGALVRRTVEPWDLADVVDDTSADVAGAIVNISKHFTIEGAEQL
jgi:hypothetical protein